MSTPRISHFSLSLSRGRLRRFQALVSLAVLTAGGSARAGWVEEVDLGNEHIYGICFADTTNGWAVGSSGKIWHTGDGGANWSEQDDVGNRSLRSVYFIDSNTGYVAGDSGSIYRTTDGGVSWIQQTAPGSDDINAIQFPVDASTGYAVGDAGSIWKTTDGGVTWNAQVSGSVATLRSVHFPVNANEGWIVGDAGSILYTSDGGANWGTQTPPEIEQMNGVYFVDGSNGLAVGDNGRIWKTVDGGASWSVQTSGVASNLRAVQLLSASVGFAVGNNGTVLKTTDGGATWSLETTPAGGHANALHFPTPDFGRVVLNGGVIWAFSAQAYYDYFNRSPGVDIFAYDGTSFLAEVPSDSTTPDTPLNGGEYNRIKTEDGTFHSLAAFFFSYSQMRFAIQIDETETAVEQIDVTWVGRGSHTWAAEDGARLYIWNYGTSSYELLDDSGDTDGVVTLTGSLSTGLTDYIGGTGEDTVTLLAVTRSAAGLVSSVTLSTDYVKLDITASSLVAGLDHFALSHDGAGIHCLAESITITAVDAGGLVLTDYTGSVTLDTQTGSGSWSDGGNAGSFSDAVADDGIALYTFDASDGGIASFWLTYTSGVASFDIDVYEAAQIGLRDDDTEGPITFSPSGFTFTASALANPPPNPIADPVGPQTAGTTFAVHLAAYGQTATDPTCGVIESYAGSKSLKFWFSYSDPASGTVGLTVDGSAIASSEGAAVAQSVAFVAGQASVAVKYKDVGRIQIHVKDDTVSEPLLGIAGSSDVFVVRPADLVIAAVTRSDLTANPGATTPAGDIFVAAGDAFRVVVEVRDAEGSLTPNYGLEASPEGVTVAPASLVAPAGGQPGTVGGASAFSADAPAGTFTATSVSWSEVGATTFRASVADGDYLGAGDVPGSESAPIGRFTPSYFDAAVNAPLFQTACQVGAFTYVGQPFNYVSGSEPVVTLTARNLAGAATQNYSGTWFRLTPASATNLAYSSVSLPLDVAAPNPPAVSDLGGGVGTLTFGGGPSVSFSRGAPVEAFSAAISLSTDVVDLDGISSPDNPVRFDDIDFDVSRTVRYGRIALDNAHGSELVALDMPLRAEFYSGGSFSLHSDDSCSSISAADLVLTPTPVTLVTSPTIGDDPLLAGDAGLSLSAPGAGNDGAVLVEVDLRDGSGAGLPWLHYPWPGAQNGDQNPEGLATFGIYRGSDRVIFFRELY